MKKNDNTRIYIFLGIICACFSLIGYRLFILSYVKHSVFARTADAQASNISSVLARGNIYFSDKSGEAHIVATNKKFPVVTLVGSKIDDEKADELASKLQEIMAGDPTQIAKFIRINDKLARMLPQRLTTEQLAKVKELGIPGVGVTYEMDRFYPSETLGADILGFLGYGEKGRTGQYGVEYYYDSNLFGRKAEKSSRSNLVAQGLNLAQFWKKDTEKEKEKVEFDRPQDLVLTIDKNIQRFAEEKLEELLKKWSAPNGSIIIQDPETGKILAMVDRPTFNPNTYRDAEPELFLNANVQQIFEPGSSFKPITMAAGLDLAKITPQTTFEDTGSLTVANYTIKNFSDKVFGVQTMSQVLEKSINTGTMHVENVIGDDNFLNYVINMGFGQRTGIDLPGELNGDITNLYSGRKINYLTASFGQGIAVTPMQMINAYSAIANGGKLMRPYIVEKVTTEGGGEEVTKPEIIGIPISEKTSAKLKTMLVGVVDSGFDKARVSGYDVAGKTGTAQIPDSKGGYIEDQFIHNFVGFAPASNPKFVIFIKIDKPQGVTFASDSLSPTFRDITVHLLQYFNVPPTRQ